MSRNCFIRSSSKVNNNENYNSKYLRTLNCEKNIYRNDQYGQCNSVNSSVRTGRYKYNMVNNNINNKSITLDLVSHIELSNTYIYEYLQKNIPVAYIYTTNTKYFYKYSCVSSFFYIIDNILYAKDTFNYKDTKQIELAIKAIACIGNNKCNTITRKFIINIINSYEIQDILSLCDIDYEKNNYLLSYLTNEEREDIYILKNIKWDNYYNNKIIEKDYIVDTSFITDEQQMYQISILTEYLDNNYNYKTKISVFDKKILNTLKLLGEAREGSVLSIDLTNSKNNKYSRYNKYFWWIVDSNNNYTILDNIKTHDYTIRASDIGKQIMATAMYRTDYTIVIRNVSLLTNVIENIDNPPTGCVIISGSLNVGGILYIHENISDLDGISSKTLTWYKSLKNVGSVNNAIYEWQKSPNSSTPNWSNISNSNNQNYTIPLDNSLIGYIYRIKATVYDLYGNSKIYYSNISEPIANIEESDEDIYEYTLSGDTIVGQTINVLYNGNIIDNSDNSLKFYWYRSYNKTDWNYINYNYYLPYYTIPISQEDLYVNQYLRVTVITKDENDKSVFINSNTSDIIYNYELLPNSSAILNGTASEGSILNVILNTNSDIDLTDYTIEYIWETSSDKITWITMTNVSNYSLQEVNNQLEYVNTTGDDTSNLINDNSFTISSNGFFVNKYIRSRIIFKNSEGIKYLLTNITSKIENTDKPATGTITLTGSGNFGTTVNSEITNLFDADGVIVTKNYKWQYNDSNSWIDIGSNTNYFDIPSNNQDLNDTDLRVVLTTVDALGGVTTLYSNSIKMNSVDTETNTIYISGETIEGSTLSVIISNTLNSNNIVKYIWKYSYDNITYYNLFNINNSSTFTIPSNNTFIGKYIIVDILYNNNNNIITYSSPPTTKIKFLNKNMDGTLLIQGVFMLGQELHAQFEGLFDEDSILLDENNEPYRDNSLVLNRSHIDYKFKASISYTDDYGTYNIIYSNYTNYIRKNEIIQNIPYQPCVFYTEITEDKFINALNECNHIILGLGGIASISEDLILQGGQKILIDGGTLNIVNCNLELLNYSELIVSNYGKLIIYGNLTINEYALYETDENIVKYLTDEILTTDINSKCKITTTITDYTLFNSILTECDNIYVQQSGNIILKDSLILEENKVLTINKHASLSILNSDLHLKSGSSLYVYGIFIITGSIIIEENATYFIDKNAIFFSDFLDLQSYYNKEIDNEHYLDRCEFIINNVGLNTIIINTVISVNDLNNYFNEYFQIEIGDGGSISDKNVTLTITSGNSLVISENAQLNLTECTLEVNEGGILQIDGSFNMSNGEIIYHFDSTVLYSESSEINISL